MKSNRRGFSKWQLTCEHEEQVEETEGRGEKGGGKVTRAKIEETQRGGKREEEKKKRGQKK